MDNERPVMPPFRNSPEDVQRLDYKLLQNGAVTLYWRSTYLDEDAAWLVAHAYRLHDFDASAWQSVPDMHQALANGLAFPDHYGNNLDALNDSLRGLEFGVAGGLALVFRRFDAFVQRAPREAAAVLDVAEYVSGQHLFGQRLIVLVQTDDPQLEVGLLGARTASWNWREWLLASRGRRDGT